MGPRPSLVIYHYKWPPPPGPGSIPRWAVLRRHFDASSSSFIDIILSSILVVVLFLFGPHQRFVARSCFYQMSVLLKKFDETILKHIHLRVRYVSVWRSSGRHVHSLWVCVYLGFGCSVVRCFFVLFGIRFLQQGCGCRGLARGRLWFFGFNLHYHPLLSVP